jgi:hypothetical protein
MAASVEIAFQGSVSRVVLPCCRKYPSIARKATRTTITNTMIFFPTSKTF